MTDSRQFKTGELVETLVKSKSRGSMYWLPARVMKNQQDEWFDLKILPNMADRFGISSLNNKVSAKHVRAPTEIKVGTAVKVDENKDGVVRWVGKDKVFGSTKETWYGIELSQRGGFSDGNWKGKRFFTCNRWHGMFVKRERLMPKPGSGSASSGGVSSNPVPQKSASIPKRAKLGDFSDPEPRTKKPLSSVKSEPTLAAAKKAKNTLSLDDVEEEEKYVPSPLSPRLKTKEETQIRQTFKFFDKNKDQRIDATELKAVMKSLGSEIDDLGVKLLMDDFDMNKNGTIEWAEFLTMMKQIGGMATVDVKGTDVDAELNIG